MFALGVYSAAQDARNRSFLEERRSPLKAIRTSGSVVVVRNVSKKEILTWDEMCLARSGDRYKILELFTLDMKSPLKPGDMRGDSFDIDGAPVVICSAYGGTLAISEVQFRDGTSWKSRWLRTTLQKAPFDQK
jgi:hypothetical protein